MFFTVTTEFVPPTATRGARIRASLPKGGFVKRTLMIAYPQDTYDDLAHLQAAESILAHHLNKPADSSVRWVIDGGGYSDNGYTFTVAQVRTDPVTGERTQLVYQREENARYGARMSALLDYL